MLTPVSLEVHMTTRLRAWFVGVAMVTVSVSPVIAQDKPQDKPTIKRVPAQPIQSVRGADNYQEYCAVCHGTQGKRDGPAARALKTPPADLTTIAKRRGGKFPSLDVAGIIKGEREMPSHGGREMPMWGSVFRSVGVNADDRTPEMRIRNLTDYLESLQVK
jgi:mono/diheme cytochrome c family protein